MSNLESSNPVSHASGEADTPFCWVIVATGWHGEWIADTCDSESEADGVLASRGSGYSGATYRKEPLCLGSTLSSLRAEHDALKAKVKELSTPDIIGIHDSTYYDEDGFDGVADIGNRIVPLDWANRVLPGEWCAVAVVTAWDEEGDVDETDIQIFPSLVEAREAIAASQALKNPTPGSA